MTADEIVKYIKANPHLERMKNSYKYNSGVREAWMPIWVRNSARSYAEVEKRFAVKNCDLSQLPRPTPGQPILILGSGPSLDETLPYLKDWQGAIFCSTSQLPVLEYLGVEPTYCLLIDADPSMVFLVRDYAANHSKTIFITHPQIPREYMECWKGDMYFFRMNDPGDEFSQKYLPMAYGMVNEQTRWHIGSHVLNSGNIINAAIPISAALGYTPIFLCGYDLGYPRVNGQVNWRASSAKKTDKGWEVVPPAPMPTQEVRPIKYETSLNGVMCDELCFFYKLSFMILYGLGAMPIISCSKGILGELPYADPEKVIHAQGKGFESLIRPPIDTFKIAQTYLSMRDIYLTKADMFVETMNIKTRKHWWQRVIYVLRWRWWKSRPWKWQGGKGWTPYFIKRNKRKAANAAAKAAKEKVLAG